MYIFIFTYINTHLMREKIYHYRQPPRQKFTCIDNKNLFN